MDISLFDFNLPEELIAQFPAERRDESMLMVVDRRTGLIRHTIFKRITKEIPADSIMVFNNSRVIPCRIFGRRNGRGLCEVFIHKILNDREFVSFLKPHRRFKSGDSVFIDGVEVFKVVEIDKENKGNRLIIVSNNSIYDVMSKYGHMPLPPYIKREDIKGIDDVRYQTVYAEKNGSIAAPTAGLHFTQEVMDSISQKGIKQEFITLYVGIGTFAPVRVRNIIEHKMHSEEYEITDAVAGSINNAKISGKRIICVGTTTVRTLESNFVSNRKIVPGRFSTDIFIYPGFQFGITDMMITNFHLPKSTLFMLVCAFAGRELMLRAYNEAIREKYRFFSYGDAMLIR